MPDTMDLLCPDCRAGLVMTDSQNAACTAHQGRYQVLFDRSAGVAQPAAEPAANLTVYPRGIQARCAQHPDVQAVVRCRVCQAGVCATCDFLLPGGVHVCPACLEQEPSEEISPARRNRAIGAIVVAFVTTMIFAMLLTGTLHVVMGRGETTDMIAGSLILWPAVAGLVLSLTAFDRRLRNSALIWTAVVWNSLHVALFLLLMVIGLAKG
jgi:hypothetical protein